MQFIRLVVPTANAKPLPEPQRSSYSRPLTHAHRYPLPLQTHSFSHTIQRHAELERTQMCSRVVQIYLRRLNKPASSSPLWPPSLRLRLHVEDNPVMISILSAVHTLAHTLLFPMYTPCVLKRPQIIPRSVLKSTKLPSIRPQCRRERVCHHDGPSACAASTQQQEQCTCIYVVAHIAWSTHALFETYGNINDHERARLAGCCLLAGLWMCGWCAWTLSLSARTCSPERKCGAVQ